MSDKIISYLHHSNEKNDDVKIFKEKSENMINIKNINNKDLLLVSLLEYVCTIHNKSDKIFNLICDYLKENGIIDKEDVYSDDSSYLRDIYIKMIKTLVGPNKMIKYNNKGSHIVHDELIEHQNVSQSRYNSEFIEIEKLGDGGFGSVHKVFNKLDQKLYAIKQIPIKTLDNEKSKFYLNEVRHLAALNHQNIVRYYTTWIEFGIYNFGIGSFDGQLDGSMNGIIDKTSNKIVPILFIQMELCDINLADFMEGRNYRSSFDFGEAIGIFSSILDGVEHIHSQDIIHRDLSPVNIFMDDKLNIKIGDFGLSRKVSEKINTESDDYGNAIYMAPEDLNEFVCTERSDVYTLGILFLELLVPFNTMVERLINIKSLKDRELDKFTMINPKYLKIMKLMTMKDPNLRPTVSEVKQLLFD
jgi:hypothetical protein